LYTNIINRFISIQTGLIYHSINYELVGDHKMHYDIHLDNINVPLLIGINSDVCKVVNYSLFTGFQFGRNINSTLNNQNYNLTRDTIQTVIALNKCDIGIAYGAGMDIALNKSRNIRLELGGRGSFGLGNICGKVDQAANEENIFTGETTINTFGGYAGIKFAF
ncbi:MAG: outer membrane beta-barrel protein, partial [Chitinophagales bacterium]